MEQEWTRGTRGGRIHSLSLCCHQLGPGGSRRLLRPPAGEVYVRAENPRGEIGVYLVSDGADRPYRLKVRPPSFCNLSAIRQMLIDTWVADSVVVLGSLDIVMGEVDR